MCCSLQWQERRQTCRCFWLAASSTASARGWRVLPSTAAASLNISDSSWPWTVFAPTILILPCTIRPCLFTKKLLTKPGVVYTPLKLSKSMIYTMSSDEGAPSTVTVWDTGTLPLHRLNMTIYTSNMLSRTDWEPRAPAAERGLTQTQNENLSGSPTAPKNSRSHVLSLLQT